MAKKTYELEPKHFTMLKVAARETGRYTRSAIGLEPPGRAVVTDGRRLLVSVVKAGVGVQELLVDRQECELAQNMQAAAKSKTVAVSGDDKALTIQAGTLKATADRSDSYAKFPALWPDVVPKDEPEASVCVNARLLGELLLTIAAQFEGDFEPYVHLGLPHADAEGNRLRPVVVWTGPDSTAQCLGVLMPCSDTYQPDQRTWQEARAAMLDEKKVESAK